MITVANRIYVNPDHTEAFEERFKNRRGLVDNMPGFINNYVLRPTKEGDPYVVLTFWESQEAFEGWVNSPEFKQGHARSGTMSKDAFPRKNEMEMHEVFTSTA